MTHFFVIINMKLKKKKFFNFKSRILVVRRCPDDHWDDDFRRLPRVLRLSHGDGRAEVQSRGRNPLPVLLHLRVLCDVPRRILPQQQLAPAAGDNQSYSLTA